MFSKLHVIAYLLSFTYFLQASSPNIKNLDKCIEEVQKASLNPPLVLTFESYATNYHELISDLKASVPYLPHVYQETAAKPLITFLQNLGEDQYLQIFNGEADDEMAILQEIIPDAALSVLNHNKKVIRGINAFEEVVSDLYDGFLSNEDRVSKQSGRPIDPPTYGSIPPLVKFGEEEAGPYTWPADATSQILGMGCGIVSLPPSQLKGGLLAWSTLGHETAGHDVTHADEGLLDELAQKVKEALLKAYGSAELADYWAQRIDEATADVCGYLNMGPSLGIALIGYFRAWGDGKLRTIGYIDDPHPLDLLRGYLAAAVVKQLNFKDSPIWSALIKKETKKDNGPLYLIDENGYRLPFPVSLDMAIASTDIVARVIMKSKLSSLQKHSLQELEDWKDKDQAIVNNLVTILKKGSPLPSSFQGPEFYAAYVVASATQAGLEEGAPISSIFNRMISFLAQMHLNNPTWSQMATQQSIALLEKRWKNSSPPHQGKHIVHYDIPEQKELVHH